MWYVYIICCRDNNLYTGITPNISRRLDEHNTKRGGSYTRIRTPVQLVYKETYVNKIEAQEREDQIKKWSRKKKLALIANNKTLLRNLSISHD